MARRFDEDRLELLDIDQIFSLLVGKVSAEDQDRLRALLLEFIILLYILEVAGAQAIHLVGPQGSFASENFACE